MRTSPRFVYSVFLDERKEVRRNEEAHHVVGRGAHDGADDVVLWGGVRQAGDNLLQRGNHHTPGELDEFAGSVVSPRLSRLQRERLLTWHR